MAGKKRWVRVAMLALVVGISSAISAYVGLKAGRLYERNQSAADMPRLRCLLWSLKEAAGLIAFHSQKGQDRWIVHEAFPDVDDGFFVDVGSADGVTESNTKVLEDLGWNGICIDPFPTGMEDRTSKMVKAVVYSEAGKKIKFKVAGGLGGIDEHIDRYQEASFVKEAETVELTTTTLDDILGQANAPGFIHYMSLDIEGAELEALKGFSFSKYKVGAFTIEHNYEEPKRTEVRSLLESRGSRISSRSPGLGQVSRLPMTAESRGRSMSAPGP